MSFLLMLCLTLVCLPGQYPPPPAWLHLTETDSAGCALLYVLLVGLHAFWTSHRVTGTLLRQPWRRDAVLTRYDRRRFLHQILLIGLYLALLVPLGWGWAVRRALWSHAGHSLPGVELATLAPFLLALLAGWVFFYDADRAAHQSAYCLAREDALAQTWLEARLASAPPFGGRWAYVGFQLRQKLALVFVPVFMVIALNELQRLLPARLRDGWSAAAQGLSIAALVAVLVGWPLVIRFVLGLKPLTPGRLRDRLEAAAARLGFRCADVLVWDTRNGMANAMIVGLLPRLRYVIFTDRLLDEFSDDEIEAVFGHEVGHVRHGHMPFYLAFLALSMAVLGLLAENLLLPWVEASAGRLTEWRPDLVPADLTGWFRPDGYAGPVLVVVLLLAYLFTAFGFLSRRCERQADLFGCRAVSCADPCCFGHGSRTPLAPRGGALCPSGISTFIRALEKVALVNGISRDRPGFFQSWQHGSIAARVAALEAFLRRPWEERRFQGRLARLKWGVVAGLLGTLVVLVGAFNWGW